MAAPDGFLIVDKPADWTSHDVVARCRRLAATRKVGHAGTLDPMATGVLVVGVGRATRLLGHLSLSTKGYDATIRLGQSTVTDDAEGEVLESWDATALTDAEVRAAVRPLVGSIQQVPSSVSAIKVHGQRAYKRVRDGETLDLAPRSVTVTEFTVDSVRRHNGLVDVDVHVECSTGTYVRALARDLGSALGAGGHLSALRRTRVGPYTLDDARTLDQLASELVVISLAEVAAANFVTYTVDPALVFSVRNGRALQIRITPGDGRAATSAVKSLTSEVPLCGVAGHPSTSDVRQSPGAFADERKNEESANVGEEPADPEPIAVMSLEGEFLALYAQHGPVAHAVAVFAPTPSTC